MKGEAMIAQNTTVRTLVSQFERENEQLIGLVASLSDAQGQIISVAEGWPLVVIAHHVASDHVVLAEIARAMATGESRPPITFEMLHQINAQHAQAHAHCTRSETLDLLRHNGERASAIVGEISETELDRTAVVFAGMPPATVKWLIEAILIGHVAEHRASIAQSTASEDDSRIAFDRRDS
jgi:hypothetical protein